MAETGANLQNRAEEAPKPGSPTANPGAATVVKPGEPAKPAEPRGAAAAQAEIDRMKAKAPKSLTPEDLDERMKKAAAIEGPAGDTEAMRGAFRRGRDAALTVLRGEEPQ